MTVRPNKEELEDLHFNKKLNKRDLARHYDVDYGTIYKWFSKLGITSKQSDLMPSKEKLEELYINQKLTKTELSNHYNVGMDTIRRWFEKLDIKSNNDYFQRCTGRPQKKKPDEKITKEWLENAYYTEQKTQKQIADETGIARWTIQQLFRKYDIEPIHTRQDRSANPITVKNLSDPEWLKEQHYTLGKTATEIAQECNVSDVTVLSKFIKFGMRHKNLQGGYKWRFFKDAQKLIEEITKLNKTLNKYEIAEHYNVTRATVYNWFRHHGIKDRQLSCPKEQKDLYNFLVNYTTAELNKRGLQQGRKEIDIWLPDHKIGIEINGCWFHSTKFNKGRNNQKNKTDYANQKGYRLFQFYDKEYKHKSDIVKSMILNAIGIHEQKIYARKTKIVQVPQGTANYFYNSNHIQGQTASKHHIGLEHDGKLVSLMSFSKSRFNKNVEWELTRFCSLLNTQVVGAASKLLAHFIKEYNPNTIISYADRSISNGNVYDKLGFKMTEELRSDYKYYVYGQLKRKQHFRHSKLPKILANYDPNLTERANCANNGIYQVYDCGKLQYIWSK